MNRKDQGSDTSATPPAAKALQQGTQTLGFSSFALGRKPAWRSPRGASRPINLERRARFARSYGGAP